MKKYIIAVSLAALTCGCRSSHSGDDAMNITYLALGDSYTVGESVVAESRWPLQLKDSLEAAGIDVEAVRIIAQTGWTTDELAGAVADSSLTEKYDLVSLLIGVNNQYRGRDAEEFRGEYASLLRTAASLAKQGSKGVFAVSIPDWGVTPFAEGRDRAAVAAAIDRYNRIKKEESLKQGVRFFDITSVSRQAETDSTLIAADGLHPSAKMYSRWVSLLLPEVKKMAGGGDGH